MICLYCNYDICKFVCIVFCVWMLVDLLTPVTTIVHFEEIGACL